MTSCAKTDLKRARCAHFALEAFSQDAGNVNEPLEASINDLTCNLGHLCDRESVDFVAVVSKAVACWKIEQVDPDGIADPPYVDLIIVNAGGV